MKRSTLMLSLALTLAMLTGLSVQAKATCPSPPPACSGSNPGAFFGTFGCTLVSTSSSGQVNVSLAQIVADGNSNIIQFTTATNNNNGSGTTFVSWASQGTNGTNCVNDDMTGYIFPPASAGICPFAMFIDISGLEVRLLDSTQNNAGTAVCELATFNIP
jgi:hypothetical protein